MNENERLVSLNPMAENQTLLSVGIDVGTTTTQVVFSRLEITNVARTGLIPRMEITDKQVLYQSPIVFTPLLDQDLVDAEKLNEIVRREYQSAGIEPGQVATGAVIITGETARKKNADAILQSLSGLAGDFIVSVAGPHLESLISGRGSGAAQYSREHYLTVTNLDIGGGSTNCAVFKGGNLIGSAAMNYGGRILILNHASGRVLHIAQAARSILQDCQLSLKIGDTPALADLRRFTDRMAEVTLELIEGGASPLAKELYLTPPSLVSGAGSSLMFSGGVGYYYYHPLEISTVADVTLHDDVGPLLAESLRNNAALAAYRVVTPAETLRATVLGASTQTVSLSGSTIWAEREILPLRNIPVLHLPVEPAPDPTALAAELEARVRRNSLNPTEDHYAFALDLNASLDFASLQQLATGIAEFAGKLPEQMPLLIVVERDYARVLGQTVKSLAPGHPLLVIDQIGLMEGDYIDIGTPLMDGRVVPISVKTLVFYN